MYIKLLHANNSHITKLGEREEAASSDHAGTKYRVIRLSATSTIACAASRLSISGMKRKAGMLSSVERSVKIVSQLPSQDVMHSWDKEKKSI